jgi:hypothetical protein
VSRHEGRTAVITGAALGLGREYARHLASEGRGSSSPTSRLQTRRGSSSRTRGAEALVVPFRLLNGTEARWVVVPGGTAARRVAVVLPGGVALAALPTLLAG